jgi:probable phosphoglycerate mutase
MNDPFLVKRDNATELFLIRHGDAIPGAEEIIPSGIYNNLPLSQKGRQQAAALAERLKSIHFDAVFSSPLRRCLETAAPLVAQIGLEPEVIEDIKEVHLGDVIAMPEMQASDDLATLSLALRERQEEIIRQVGPMGNWDAIPGSESSKAFRRRVQNAIDKIVMGHNGQRVLIFAHGGVINAYAAEALDLDRDFFFPCANTSITVIRANRINRVIYVLNDIAHLKIL